jgi:hypothetical protein
MDVLAFCLIVVFVIILIVVIALRSWYLIQPYIELISSIIKMFVIIKSFTTDVILAIANYIKAVKSDLFALFKFGNLDLVIMNNYVQCGKHLDDCISEKVAELKGLGNKIIIGAFGKGAYAGIKLANLLASSGKEVYLVMLEPVFPDDDYIAPIKGVNIINVLPEGEKALVKGINMFISNPLSRNIEGYIQSIEKGMRAAV